MALQLVGEVDTRDEDIRRLQRQLDEAERRNAELNAEVRVVRSGVTQLRQQLMPLKRALDLVFGEMDAVGRDASAIPTDNKWNAIKQRLAPRLRDAIDILLLQGSMRRTHLASALKMDYSNCNKNVINILLRQGWMIDNGGNLTLKEL